MPRKAGYTHNKATREKIQAANIIHRLQSCINGDVELTATQVNAANILLKKVIPDLASIQHSGDQENPIKAVTTVELVPVKPDDNSED